MATVRVRLAPVASIRAASRAAAASLLWLCLSSCQRPDAPPTRQDLDLLRSLKPESAAQDARRAVADGDCRLLGVGGYGAPLPLEDASRLGVREIPASDRYVSQEHRRLSIAAAQYVDLYTCQILSTPPCRAGSDLQKMP